MLICQSFLFRKGRWKCHLLNNACRILLPQQEVYKQLKDCFVHHQLLAKQFLFPPLSPILSLEATGPEKWSRMKTINCFSKFLMSKIVNYKVIIVNKMCPTFFNTWWELFDKITATNLLWQISTCFVHLETERSILHKTAKALSLTVGFQALPQIHNLIQIWTLTGSF